MTNIEQMIQNLCPNGVEWKTLGEVTYWDKRFNEVDRSLQPQIRKYHYYLANELEELERPTGTIKILYTSNRIAYADEETVAENVVDAEVVAVPWGGNANIKYFKGKFITADNRIAVVRDPSILSTKFVYYWLTKNQAEIDSYYRGAGIKHPSMLKVLSLPIPLPPLEIQEKIVECLDKFSALAAELQAELQMRRKQYEYYRTHLLTPHSDCNSAGDSTDDCNWEWKTLGEICDIKGRIGFRGYTRADQVEKGEGAISLSPANIKNSTIVYDDCTYITWAKYEESPEIMVDEGDIIFCKTASVGKTAYIQNLPEKATINPQLVLLKNIKCNNKYLSYYLQTDAVQNAVKQYQGVGSVPNVSQAKLSEIKIALPSLAEQERIVSILDKFEALTTSLSDGIPAEQAAQQKRYEYYRDLLLTFPRKEV